MEIYSSDMWIDLMETWSVWCGKTFILWPLFMWKMQTFHIAFSYFHGKWSPMHIHDCSDGYDKAFDVKRQIKSWKYPFHSSWYYLSESSHLIYPRWHRLLFILNMTDHAIVQFNEMKSMKWYFLWSNTSICISWNE